MSRIDDADVYAHEGRLMIRSIGTDVSTVTVGTALQFSQGVEHQFKALARYGGFDPKGNHEVLDLASQLPWTPGMYNRFAWLAATAQRYRERVVFPGTAAYASHTQEVDRDFWHWAEDEANSLADFTAAVGSYARGNGPAPPGWVGQRKS